MMIMIMMEKQSILSVGCALCALWPLHGCESLHKPYTQHILGQGGAGGASCSACWLLHMLPQHPAEWSILHRLSGHLTQSLNSNLHSNVTLLLAVCPVLPDLVACVWLCLCSDPGSSRQQAVGGPVVRPGHTASHTQPGADYHTGEEGGEGGGGDTHGGGGRDLLFLV